MKTMYRLVDKVAGWISPVLYATREEAARMAQCFGGSTVEEVTS